MVRLHHVLGLFVGGLLTVACGSTSEVDAADGSESKAALPTPHSSALSQCEGVGDVAAAERLIIGGAAVALADVSLSREPDDEQYNSRTVVVDEAQLLAGSVPNGVIEAVELAAVNGQNPLPPGRYLVLLGEAGPKSTYFLSNGVQGSFAVEGDSAFQRCPDPSGGEGVLLVRTGITDQNELESAFERAFESVGAGEK